VRSPLTGRLTLAAVFAMAAGGAAVVWLLDRSGELWTRILSRAGVPVLIPTFADLRAYTTAWECDRAGIDVFVTNPCDPWRRVLVPPRVPAELGFLGLGESATVPLALGVIAAFFISVLVVAGPLRLLEAPVYAAIVFSPSVLLGLERANTDLLVFVLLTIVLVTVRADGRLRAVSYGSLLLAAMLKLYPIFAAGVLLRHGRRRAVEAGFAVVLPFAIYLLLTRDDLALMRQNMVHFAAWSWGASVLPMEYGMSGRRETLFAVSGLAVALVLSAGLAVILRHRPAPRDGYVSQNLDAFWIGASVYVGTFAVAANHNYKLVFLIFVVPQLLSWMRETKPRVPCAGLALLATVAMCWVGVEIPVVPDRGEKLIWARQVWFPFDEAVGWVLFAYLATALLLPMPRGLLGVRRESRVEPRGLVPGRL
jgi:hypothetical protein